MYRTPLGTVSAGLDWGIWHEVATATIQAFLHLLTEALARPAWAAEPVTKPATQICAQVPPEPETP